MIILLSGSINSGKSTVAKKLAERFEKPAIVEGDSLRTFIDSIPLEEAIPVTLENIVAVVRNLSKRGFTCIVPYPLSQNNHQFVTQGLQDCGEVLTFTLSPKIEKALSDNPNRILNEWEKKRIQHHYSVGTASPSFGFVIDTTNQSPIETTEKIFEIIQDLSASASPAKLG